MKLKIRILIEIRVKLSLLHRLAIRRTKNAGSSLANCDFVSTRDKKINNESLEMIISRTFSISKIPEDLLWCNEEIPHLPESKFKIHLSKLDESSQIFGCLCCGRSA
jgi:hypothetical protein